MVHHFRSDGEFVDIVHTNSGNLWDGCLSIPKVQDTQWLNPQLSDGLAMVLAPIN